MHSSLVLSGPKGVHEEDAVMLCALFPKLDMSDAYAVLRQQGSVEKAANVLVDVEVVEDVVQEGSGAEEGYKELPNFLRCPKCYSSDLLLEDETSTVVCIKCHHHFAEHRAKRGAVRSIGSGRTNVPKKTTKKPIRVAPSSPPTSPASDDISAGPMLQKLQQTRAEKAANPMLRLVVSYAGSPKEKKVIHVPQDDGCYASLMKQARAKFRLRKPLKGLRSLPEGIPLAPEDVEELKNGSEVLVTLHCDTPKTPLVGEGFPTSPVAECVS